ncbi:MAG: phytanoyl-CoA dioxygenase family protein [Actinomycetes bacterium]
MGPGPHGPWVLGPDHRADPRYTAAPAAQQQLADAFHQDGYAVVPDLVPAATVLAARSAAEAEYARRGPATDRVIDAWRWRPGVRALAVSPEVLGLVSFLLGRRAVPFQTLSFRTGTEQQAHADSIHFDTLPAGFTCGVWVALEDVGPGQGPLVVHPGSHRRPPAYPEDLGLAPGDDHREFDRGRYEDVVAATVTGLPGRRLEVAQGTAVVWAADLVHGGAPVEQPDTTRWSQVTHFFGAGCVYVTPQRSHRVEGRYAVRDPLVNVASGRPEPQPPAGWRFVRTPDRLTRVEADSAPAPALAARAASAAVGLGRRAKWHAAARRDRFRR